MSTNPLHPKYFAGREYYVELIYRDDRPFLISDESEIQIMDEDPFVFRVCVAHQRVEYLRTVMVLRALDVDDAYRQAIQYAVDEGMQMSRLEVRVL